MRGQASDETGVLDLTTAASLQFRAKSGATTISGVAEADTPPIADADGIHHWNWHYVWVGTDTSVIGTYSVALVATWAGSKPQHFIGPTLSIIADPTA